MVAEATWGETIGDLAADLDRIVTRRDQLEADIETAFLEHPLGKVLNTMCGFGSRAACCLRRASSRRLAIRPFQYHPTGTGGNHRLKNAMFVAAFVATRHDPDARAYYLRKRAEGKRHNAAVICVARRCCCSIILAMLKTRTPYRAQQPDKPRNLPHAAWQRDRDTPWYTRRLDSAGGVG